MKRVTSDDFRSATPRWLAVTVVGVCTLAAAAQAQTPPSQPVPGGSAPGQGPGPGYSDPASPSAAPAGAMSPSPAPSPSWTYPSSSSWRNSFSREDGYSLLPYTRRGYAGINLGRADFRNDCGAGGYACDNPNVSVSLYTGGLFNDWFGMELGYMNTGKADRSGGESRAQGVSLSLVARAAMGAFNVFAKGGALYGQTRVSAGPLSTVTEGKRRGWGGTYGVGLGFDFTPTSGVVLEWQRHEFRFPGASGRDNVDNTSLGYVHRF